MKKLLSFLVAAAIILTAIPVTFAEDTSIEDTETICDCDLCDECGKCHDKYCECEDCPGACPGHYHAKYDCSNCEDSGCFDCTWILGDVNGDGEITSEDADEILKYLGYFDSVIDNNNRAFQSALVTGGSEPSIIDVHAILHYVYIGGVSIEESAKLYKICDKCNRMGYLCVCLAGVVKGDIDGDGKVTIDDALIILVYLTGHLTLIDTYDNVFKAACITGESQPVIGDVLEILKYLAGLESLIKI